MLWRILWRTNPLVLAVMVACSGTPKITRVDTGEGKAVIFIPRTTDVQPVVVEEEEFHDKMPLPGHYGPHPKRYHELIHEDLLDATLTCRSLVECREALTGALQKLARQIATPGTELNRLVTRQ